MIDVPAALHHPSSLETARFPGGSFPLTGVLRGALRADDRRSGPVRCVRWVSGVGDRRGDALGDPLGGEADLLVQQCGLAVRDIAIGQPNPQDSKSGQQTGEAVNQAKNEVGKAQSQLNQGQNQGAKASMEKAADALAKAAEQMNQQGQPGDPTGKPGQPNQATRPDKGIQAGGTPDASMFGPDMQKYAGKSWGELPGELRTKIVQDMKDKYGDDYARMIKLYFEQIATTYRPASTPAPPATAPPRK